MLLYHGTQLCIVSYCNITSTSSIQLKLSIHVLYCSFYNVVTFFMWYLITCLVKQSWCFGKVLESENTPYMGNLGHSSSLVLQCKWAIVLPLYQGWSWYLCQATTNQEAFSLSLSHLTSWLCFNVPRSLESIVAILIMTCDTRPKNPWTNPNSMDMSLILLPIYSQQHIHDTYNTSYTKVISMQNGSIGGMWHASP